MVQRKYFKKFNSGYSGASVPLLTGPRSPGPGTQGPVMRIRSGACSGTGRAPGDEAFLLHRIVVTHVSPSKCDGPQPSTASETIFYSPRNALSTGFDEF